MVRPKVLFIDAYDSFSNNIITLVEESLHVSVTKIAIDSELPSDLHELYAAVIIGPGPGSPYNPCDVGCITDVWALADDRTLPVLGICLGFQSLVATFGGSVDRLPYPRHGIETSIQTCNDSIFRDIETLRSIQYHSLYACIGDKSGEDHDESFLWSPRRACPELVPLAWDVDHAFSRVPPTPDDPRAALGFLNPRHILMGVRHVTKPFYGVQFHPESVCSSADARRVISNWWEVACEWNAEHKRDMLVDSGRQRWSRTIDASILTVPMIKEHIRAPGEEIVVLDSEKAQESPLGNYSIVGLVYPETLRIIYSVGDNEVQLQQGLKVTRQPLDKSHGNIFSFLKSFMSERAPRNRGSESSPFWGGLMGYIAYEACLETLGISSDPDPVRPDIQFAFVERSVVIDHEARQVHIQSIRDDDDEWVDQATDILTRLTGAHSTCEEIAEQHTTGCGPSDVSSLSSESISQESQAYSNSTGPSSAPIANVVTGGSLPPKFTIPTEAAYSHKIKECHAQIRRGDSYELCLTDQTKIDVFTALSPAWSRYLRLRTVNPAPFGAFIRLGPVTVMSSSPERFLSWSRPNASNGEIMCQFRPIKGTVKKRYQNPDGSLHLVDLPTATEILSSPKERAENLMIVDLIRHDLTGVVGSGNVRTKSLMQVEEYENVYQLVTVIEGTLKPSPHFSSQPPKMGIDVLGVSLPPGSMTGAPKKRSCQLLREIEEKKPRSIYSGVLGYIDVGGGGDFSVVIRTAYRWDDESTERGETWRIGAGGAITDMSHERAEWEEMQTKVETVLRSFQVVNQI